MNYVPGIIFLGILLSRCEPVTLALLYNEWSKEEAFLRCDPYQRSINEIR